MCVVCIYICVCVYAGLFFVRLLVEVDAARGEEERRGEVLRLLYVAFSWPELVA